MNIEPYVAIDGLEFGASIADAIGRFGRPLMQQQNRDAELELQYDGFVLRFDSSHAAFREVTFLPPTSVSMIREEIVWDITALELIEKLDGELKEVLGFIVSLRFGLAFSGFHDGNESEKAIHAFRRGDWDMFSKRMTEFNLARHKELRDNAG